MILPGRDISVKIIYSSQLFLSTSSVSISISGY
jgi:hypothetical protein